jgi:voltage-gated potassium channel
VKQGKSVLFLFTLLVIVLMAGTTGYYLLEGNWTLLDSFYMTIITLTTIGFGEVKTLDSSGRIFTVILIIAGMGVVASLISRFGQIIVESGLNNTYGRRRMLKKIGKLTEHYIICGYGRIGRSIARKLYETSIPFAVIESDSSLVETVEAKGFPVLLGDSTSDATLLAAGIEKASGILLCINDDAANVNIALASKELNPSLMIISRGSDPKVEYRLMRAGADTVVYPLRLGGEQIARLIADREKRTVDGNEQSSPSLFGYELKIFKNDADERTVGEILHHKEAVRPVAVKYEDGTMLHNVKPEHIVKRGESLLLLVNQDRSRDSKDLENREIVLIEWSDELSLGIAQIDDEHRMLFKYMRDFQNAVVNCDTRENIAHLFNLLIEYTETHFSQEEVLMTSHQYPDLEEHQILHKRLTRKVIELNRDKDFIFSSTIWDFLENWLTEHILVADKAFARFLREEKGETAY